MSTAVAVATRYLVEWYRPNLTPQLIDELVAALDRGAAETSAEGFPVWLLMTLAVPSDEVLYGVFAADSPELVETACARAGVAPERMSVDVDARVTQHVVERSADHPIDPLTLRSGLPPRLVAVNDEPERLHPPAI